VKRILLNADIGERGPFHPVDRELMDYIDIANIACGGHAGDKESVAAFRSLAEKKGARVAAHLSYPDKEAFGRRTMTLPFAQLFDSLDEQYALMQETKLVKFHGALYNDADSDEALATGLCDWMMDKEIVSVIAMQGSELADRCNSRGIEVLAEAFAERRYVYIPGAGRLSLVDRKSPDASITDLGEAMKTVRAIVDEGKVPAFFDEGPHLREARMIDISVDTICIHSDSPIALDLARAVREILDAKFRGQRGGR
jgi:UPF0271 protein